MKRKGFTLIELVFSIIIITLIALLIICFVKPSKKISLSRDAQRYDDVKKLAEAVNLYLANGSNFDNLTGPYSSIKKEGKDWIPLKLDNQPVDPVNNTVYNYRLAVSVSKKTYEINAIFENDQNFSKAQNDNGNSSTAFELGTDLTIL